MRHPPHNMCLMCSCVFWHVFTWSSSHPLRWWLTHMKLLSPKAVSQKEVSASAEVAKVQALSHACAPP
jgi:hypothetical protein